MFIYIYIFVLLFIPLNVAFFVFYICARRYWPVIDNALRAAAIDRKVNVRLLISWWKHSRPSESYFLKSLQDLTHSYANIKIEVVNITFPSRERIFLTTRGRL